MRFSRIRLNPTRRQTQKLVGSAQAMHAMVMGSLPAYPSDGTGRVLWRLDRLEQHDLQLFVVSPSAADFSGLLESAGWPTIPTWEQTDYRPFLSRLATGQRWRFRLTANPVRSVKRSESGTSARGSVSPHLTVAQQQQWLLDRASGWGFEIPGNAIGALALGVRERHTTSFHRHTGLPKHAAGNGVAITRATFEGELDIVDPDALRHSLTHGMGRAKAYGCGLMTLAPAAR